MFTLSRSSLPLAHWLLALATCQAAVGSDPSADGPAPGHSLHGEGFAEGPRRRLPLTAGCGDVHFPVNTASPEAQAYFNQGVGQLHGFWFWEAERSFRTVLQIDPACVMGHWGMAMANIGNEPRARALIAKATGPALDRATPREQAWIEAARKLFGPQPASESAPPQPRRAGTGAGTAAADEPAKRKADADRKARFAEFVAALERIALDHPDDLEARAFLLGHTWWSKDRHRNEPTSYLALDALAGEVLAASPRHPVHHYVIHLWDGKRAAAALTSAAACGPAAPAIAHMWHMPAHTYSELERWQDAAWHQQAAARVDHAWMHRAHLFPDQIHNFAHNSEWLVRNLNHLGRVQEAVAVACDLIAMPRIPRSKEVNPDPAQSFEEPGSAWQLGRDRLFETILLWEAWDTAAALADTPCLEPGTEPEDRWRREHLLALAGHGRGDIAAGSAACERLLAIDQELRDSRTAAATEAETAARAARKPTAEISAAMAKAMEPLTETLGRLDRLLAEALLHDHLAHDRLEEARQLLPRLGDLDRGRLARIHLALGDLKAAVEQAEAHAAAAPKALAPQALLCWIQWQAGSRDAAVVTLATIRGLAAAADADLASLVRLDAVAQAAGLPGDWRQPVTPAAAGSERPELGSLGPQHWQPWQAGDWTARTAADQPVDGRSLRGKEHVILLTLGQACSHCNEQLRAFAARAGEFEAAGIPLVVISTDEPAAIRDAGGTLPFPVHSGADGAAFRALDAWDDFEGRPLHATCLVAADGRMRWQHTGYEPFMLPDFLLTEAVRLRDFDAVNAPDATSASGVPPVPPR